MIPFLYDVTDRSGNLVIDNATFAEVVEGLNCSKAQANNARTSGDLIFRKYEMHRVDRKLSRVKDIALLQEFDAVKLIKETKETIKKLEKRNSVQTKDTVSGSNSEFPFQPMHFVIQGKTHDEDDKIERQKRRQQIQIEQAEKLKNDVEEWMLTIPFRMRRIIKFKIFEEMNWQQVAKHIGGKATGESVRKEFETFMKK